MSQVLTISCKLQVLPEVASNINAILVRFAAACEWINANTPVSLTNKTAMQALVYKDVRAQFGMSANLTIQAVRRVCANRKTAKQKNKEVKGFKPTSVSYDARIFSFREKDWTVSLTLLESRKRFKLLIGNYQRHYLKGQEPTSATLVKKQSGEYYIQIQIETDAPEIEDTDKVLGVDLGRTDIACTSEGDTWSGQQITKVRDHYAKLRAVLQQKATKGTRTTRRRCRQVLARLSGNEKRFQTWLNHNISRRLVDKAASNGIVIALEDLTGIRERTNQQPRSKTERRRSNSWAFYQLRQFLTYKCVVKGVKLILVNPAYTSQTCHKCLHIHPGKGKSYRNGKTFRCGHCGWKGDADYNGAKNISALGLSVNQPGGNGLSCKVRMDVEYIQLTLWDWPRATESSHHTAQAVGGE